MNKELTPIEKLDLILGLLSSSTKYQISDNVPIAKLDENEILEFIKNDTGNPIILTSHELSLILEKLVKDEFVKKEKIFRNTDPTYYYYYVSFEGAVFNERGGYKQDIINHHSEKNRVETLASYQHEQADTLNTLTRRILYVTVIAALYYLIEICKWLWKLFHSF